LFLFQNIRIDPFFAGGVGYMVNRLFYDNPHLKEWECKVEKIIEKEGKCLVVLSESAFYPEGGGQPSDRGTIDGIEVLDVFEEDDIIYHVLPSPPQNTTVFCKLDWERRCDHMQQHSGQHLLSAVFYNLYEGRTCGFHLGEEYVTIDIALPEVSAETVKEIERVANQYIYDNLEVKAYFIEPDEVNKIPLRKLPIVDEGIRVVEIVGVDYSPCCGTHVKATGEIGIIKIIKTEKYKGMTRVYFKCGKRALIDFQGKQDVTVALSRHLSVPEREIPERVEGLSNELKEALREIVKLKEMIFKYDAENIVKSSNSKVISLSFEDKSFEDIQILSKQILLLGDYIVILASTPDKRLVLSHNGNFDVHCGKIFKENISNFNGKGGGSDKQAQALFTNEEDLLAFLNFLTEQLKAHN
jgi:alanyl-tRNA synthetase